MIFYTDLTRQPQEVTFRWKFTLTFNNYIQKDLGLILDNKLNFGSGDIIYDQTYNELFHGKLESIQYSTCLAIMRTIRGTLETLQSRRWLRKFCLFCTINQMVTLLLFRLYSQYWQNKQHEECS